MDLLHIIIVGESSKNMRKIQFLQPAHQLFNSMHSSLSSEVTDLGQRREREVCRDGETKIAQNHIAEVFIAATVGN